MNFINIWKNEMIHYQSNNSLAYRDIKSMNDLQALKSDKNASFIFESVHWKTGSEKLMPINIQCSSTLEIKVGKNYKL